MSAHVLLRRVPLVLTLAAVVWCAWTGIMILTTLRGASPLVVLPLSLPIILACGAAITARFQAPDFMAVATGLFLGYVYLIGFSIGGAYHGPALLLGIATLLEAGVALRERRRVTAEV